MIPDQAESEILFVLPSPSPADQANGSLRANPYWQAIIKEVAELENGVNLVKKIGVTSLLRCAVDNGEKVATLWRRKCYDAHLKPTIERVKPKIVVAVGDGPLRLLTGSGGMVKAAGKGMINEEGWTVFCLPHLDWAVKSAANIRKFRAALSALPGLYKSTLVAADLDYKHVTESGELWDVVDRMIRTGFSFDYETTGLDPHLVRVTSVAVSTEKNEAYCFDPNLFRRHWVALLSADCPKTAHNAQFESDMSLFHFGIDPCITWDTQFYARLEDENAPTGLKHLALKHTNVGAFAESASGDQVDWENLTIEDLWKYNCSDADSTQQIRKVQKKGKTDKRLHGLHNKHLQRVPVFSQIRKNGLKVNEEVLRANTEENERLYDEAFYNFRNFSEVKTWETKHDREFNPNSPVDAKALFGEQMKLKTKIKSKVTGKASYSVKSLEDLADTNVVVDTYLKVKKHAALKKSFFETMPEFVRDGYCHPQWNIGKAKTGRSSAARPTIQNQANDPLIKTMFDCEEDEWFFNVDYSQAELRVAASLSNEPTWIEAFQEDKDLHTLMAAQAFGVKEYNVTKAQRQVAKIINFGCLYGITEWGLVKQTSLTQAEAKEILSGYWQALPKLKAWVSRQHGHAKRWGHVDAPGGMRRHLPILLEPDKPHNREHQKAVRSALNQAGNHPVQNGASELLLDSIVDAVAADIPGLIIRGQVHDSIIGTIKRDLVKYLLELQYIMTERPESWLKVPMKVDVTIGPNWYDQRDYELE